MTKINFFSISTSRNPLDQASPYYNSNCIYLQHIHILWRRSWQFHSGRWSNRNLSQWWVVGDRTASQNTARIRPLRGKNTQWRHELILHQNSFNSVCVCVCVCVWSIKYPLPLNDKCSGFPLKLKKRKEMFYLTTTQHSLFTAVWRPTLTKAHSDSENRSHLSQLHGLLVLIRSKGSFICTTPQTG